METLYPVCRRALRLRVALFVSTGSSGTLRNKQRPTATLGNRKADSFAAINGLALTLFNYFRRENGFT